MKKILLIIAVIFSANVFAQITEGTITFKHTLDSSNEEMKAQMEIMGESTSVTYFKKSKTRSEASSTIGSHVTITDLETKKSLTLIDNLMGKMFVKSELEEEGYLKVTKTDNVKEVLGYKCTKYIAEIEQGKVILYTTEEIQSVFGKEKFGKKVKGFPLETEARINQHGMLLIIKSTATEVNKDKVDDSKFDMTVPEGYTETTKDILGSKIKFF